MSDVLGPLAYDKGKQNNFLGGGMSSRRMVSEQTANAIDKEVKGIVEEAHQKALEVLKANQSLLKSISTQLLEKEVIEGKTLQGWLDQAESERTDDSPADAEALVS